MLVEKLPWDSDFFQLQIGKVQPGTFDPSAFDKECREYDLVYIFEYPGAVQIARIREYCPKPADVKITYRKHITEQVPVPAAILEYDAAEPDQQLISLALQSGIYSRFKTDKKFPEQGFEKLYRQWIIGSVNGSLARHVLVSRDPEGLVNGFVTLQKKDTAISIGLIAVDEAARGKGIGKMLIQAAEAYAQQANFLYLDVATQQANAAACSLYDKCGFHKHETVNIYHFWKT